MTRYQVPLQRVVVETVIKNSRFIAVAQHVSGAEQLQSFLRDCKQTWPQANHYCLAAIYGAPNDTQSYAMSDDGEPSGTAGKPMFQVLSHANLGEVAVVVVRYFGGVKLGTGGLQRAYTHATTEVLKKLPTDEKIIRKNAYLHYDYPDQKVVAQVLKQYDVITEQQDFGARIEQQIAVDEQDINALSADLTNATQGRLQLKQTGE